MQYNDDGINFMAWFDQGAVKYKFDGAINYFDASINCII